VDGVPVVGADPRLERDANPVVGPAAARGHGRGDSHQDGDDTRPEGEHGGPRYFRLVGAPGSVDEAVARLSADPAATVIIADFDGTLSRIVPEPADAAPVD